MKNFLLVLLQIMLITSCSKSNTDIIVQEDAPIIPFKTYIIDSAAHFCNDNNFVTTSISQLKFKVKFDSSAIYTTADINNQDDINKLYGFADNNTQHHQYSARFGWRWSNNALWLFAYIYNEGMVAHKELGSIAIGKEHHCEIKITPNHYIFSVNNYQDSLPRKSITQKAEGYKLYPYFGGDETAPHKITILIKDL